MDKKQTAVEWLIENHFGNLENCTPNFRNKINQAKAFEKQQIIDANNIGYSAGKRDTDETAEQYYNETYG